MTTIIQFLPTPSARRATAHLLAQVSGAKFLPTPSARRATRTTPCICLQNVLFLPTPSARRATPARAHPSSGCNISTHALREEGDRTGRRRSVHRYISTHALREEGDTTSLTHRQLYCKISTHALREEGDCSMLSCSIGQDNFYPRPPRGGRPAVGSCKFATPLISTHALREEGDLVVVVDEVGLFGISTHALREEGDARSAALPS